MASAVKQLIEALEKLEGTAQECQEILERERQRREEIMEQLESTNKELQKVISEEDQAILQMIQAEMAHPIEIGKKYQEKLDKQINEASFKTQERTYVVDEVSEQIVNLRGEYQLLEKQLKHSQANVQRLGNELNAKQEEYLGLQIEQASVTKELEDLREEVQEMRDLLVKVKEVQFTLNKVIDHPAKLSQTNSTEEAFKNSFITSNIRLEMDSQNKDQFWYQLPQTPPLKLPRIK